jgi:hypothetical protein
MTPTSSYDIKQRLGVGREGVQRWRRRLMLLAGLLIVMVVLGGVTRSQNRGPDIQYQTATVSTGSLTVKVTATGSLQSVTEVKVGTEISGILEKVYADYNTEVKVGQLLASINTDKLRSRSPASPMCRSCRTWRCDSRRPRHRSRAEDFCRRSSRDLPRPNSRIRLTLTSSINASGSCRTSSSRPSRSRWA